MKSPSPQNIVYQGKILEVVQQEVTSNGKSYIAEFARRAPGTRLIIPTKNDTLIITKEYRRELGEWDFRLPGGKVYDRLSEYNAALSAKANMLAAAEIAAKKEALEEVGLIVDRMSYFATSKCGATVEWDLYYFIVEEYKERTEGQQLEHGEDIQVVELPYAEVLKLCLEGGMQEERSVAILLRYFHKLKII